MEVQRVSNYQQSFNGYVGKSVIKYVNVAIKNESRNIIKKAKKNNTKPDQNALTELHYYGARILNNLSAYMDKTHKNTRIEMGNKNFSSHPRFKNPVSNHIVRTYSPLTDAQPFIDKEGEISMPKTRLLKPIKEAGRMDLDTLNSYCTKLDNGINPKDIDKAFYNAEKEKLERLEKTDLGFIATLRKEFKEAEIENFLQQIN